MKLLVNGAWRDMDVSDLTQALVALGYGDALVATALNGTFVSAASRPEIRLAEGDQLEVLAPMKGG